MAQRLATGTALWPVLLGLWLPAAPLPAGEAKAKAEASLPAAAAPATAPPSTEAEG